MVSVNASFPLPLPDDPNKWDGWSKYKSTNFYERLCLDPDEQPTNETIETHCRELLRWWQKKLPLKNQPSNPLAQMLRPGLDESSRFLTEARVELLDPHRRRQVDKELAAQAQAQTIAEFHKYLAFALADGVLRPDEEKNLLRFGFKHDLTSDEMRGFIEMELKKCGAKRAATPKPAPAAAPRRASARQGHAASAPNEEFMRMLRLSGLGSDEMTDDARDAFINMAENLGLDPGDAEDLVDLYLEEADNAENPAPALAPKRAPTVVTPPAAPKTAAAPAVEEVIDVAAERKGHPPFVNSLGMQMLFVPSGKFTMGSEASDAAPNERPLTPVTVARFYMSRFPITNGEYEAFDPSHARRRASGAGERHPVIYVSSLEAIKFCQWLGTRERKKYRLPTEAEWEYAARGTDGRKYPWGNHDGRGDLGNFADRNTVFAWSDREIDDGFAESSPVGAFPSGASPFDLEDMAGNVWEWCHDLFENYRGSAKANPRGAASGNKRVYRGGSWKSRFNSLRATARGSNALNYSCNDLGFRVVCDCE